MTIIDEPEQDSDVIAKIGDTEVTAADLIESLLLCRHWDVIQECIDNKILQTVFEEHKIEPSSDELRNYVNVFRQQNALLTGDETSKWLEAHHMDDDDFMAMCQFDISLQRLKEVLFQDKVEQYFTFRQLELASMELYKIVVSNEEAAKEIYASIEEGASFFDYAHRYSADEDTRKLCGYAGKVLLKTLGPKEQQLIAGATPGTVVGPVKVAKTYHIILVDKIYPAQFDGETRKMLMEELFMQWFEGIKAKLAITIEI